ncbi:phasin family protein [Enterovirga sp. CN4-39]|uniref:phasin family protein n=1 Tax=Enterovirga sp. CN4-39 TaxID=3400910 RepID=UPI003BFD0CAD
MTTKKMGTEKGDTGTPFRDFADKGVEQARGALGTLLETAQKAAESIQSATKTADTPEGKAVARGFGYAQQNISAILDFAQQLVRAPDMKEAARLQAEFVKEQAAVMEKQVEELKTITQPQAPKA